MVYRGSLRVLSSRLRNRSSNRTEPHSHTPRDLSVNEMKTRMNSLHNELRRIEKQCERLKEKLSKSMDENGVTLSNQLNTDPGTIVESEGSKATERQDCSYFQKIFWQQQAHASSMQNPRGMRWHPCTDDQVVRLPSCSAYYETLHQSKCIQLPSQRRLHTSFETWPRIFFWS